jgi:hypothetical protein
MFTINFLNRSKKYRERIMLIVLTLFRPGLVKKILFIFNERGKKNSTETDHVIRQQK